MTIPGVHRLAAVLTTAIVFQLASFGQTTWTKYPANPLLVTGNIGMWDSYWIGTPWVVRTDSQYTMWYSGSPNGINPQTGRAISPDGITWLKDSLNPVLAVGPPASWDKGGAFVPRVIFDGNRYVMWYAGSSALSDNQHIGRATSPDGRLWEKDSLNPVLKSGAPGEWDASYLGFCNVLFDGLMYRTWYAGGAGGSFPGTSMGIGYATSLDGRHWTKHPQNPVLVSGPPGSWDARGVGNQCVVVDSGYFHMWYTGGMLDFFAGAPLAIGYAVSTDGIHWKKFPRNPIFSGTTQSWESQVGDPMVILDGSVFKMWYTGNPDMGYATAPRDYSARIGLPTSSIDFLTVEPGTLGDSMTVSVTNCGLSLLHLFSVTQKGPEFSLSGLPPLPATVGVFDSVQFRVIFRPTTPGAISVDTLVIASSDSTHPVVRVAMRGRGRGPIIAAQAGMIYSLAISPSGTELFTIDRRSGNAVFVTGVSPHPPPAMQCLTVRRSDNLIYAASSGASATDLYRISSQYGDLEHVMTIPLGNLTAMAFSLGDTLYMSDAEGRLYGMKGFNGIVFFIDSSGIRLSGLAFSPSSDQLWASAHDTIYTVNITTGALTFVGARSYGVVHSSLACDAIGTLYALFDNDLVALDRSTAQPYSIGTTGRNDLQLIAMRSDIAGGVEPEAKVPGSFRLYQNYPNPFNPSTEIAYRVQAPGLVTLRVYDVLGREVATLVEERRAAGLYRVRFDGSGLASGVYFYRLQVNAGGGSRFEDTRTLLLLR